MNCSDGLYLTPQALLSNFSLVSLLFCVEQEQNEIFHYNYLSTLQHLNYLEICLKKFNWLQHSALFCFCVALTLLSQFAVAAPFVQTTTGWLINPAHPPISVQMQLTGQSDPHLKTVSAVLQLKLQGEWKSYWRSPGEGGVAPSLDFSASKNISDLQWSWPAPTRYPVLGVETIGYKGEVNFPITLHIEELNNPVELSGVLTISSCTNVCVLTDFDILLAFDGSQLTTNQAASFAYNQGADAVPMLIDPKTMVNQQGSTMITGFRSAWNNKKQQLTVQVDNKIAWHKPDIFIDSATEDLLGISFSAPQISISDNQLVAKIDVSSWAGNVDFTDAELNITVVDKTLAVEFSTIPSAILIESNATSFLAMFVFALIGGLILNIMPCVLPVLGMKLSTVISAHGIHKRQIRKQFLASSFGILTSFWLLAAFLLILKFSGQALGWGIQFQSPYFITVMVMITALFSANMLGLFEIQLPSAMQTWLASKGDSSYLGHYLQGMFATLLATPCSAPFLGTAVAFALGASALELIAIFSALGLGMALPWLVISAFPMIALWLPKPGRWMNTMKTLFALMVLVTCYWLLSLLTTFIGNSVTLFLGGLLTIVLLVLIAKKRGKKIVIIVLSTILVSVVALTLIASLSTTKWIATVDKLDWQPLNVNEIENQVKLGNVVFVDVTADWCVTCKANKVGVLLQQPVLGALQEQGIVVMKGDWTVPSDSITDYLQSYDRFAVPFNIVYGPGAPQGLPLPTILTSDSVLSVIEQAKGK